MGQARGTGGHELSLLLGGAAVVCAALGVAILGAPGALASTSSPSTATYFAKEWGLTEIDAPAAWQYGTGSGVKIGIVDTGVDLSHPDLAGKVVAAATCIDTGGGPAQCVSSPGSGEDDNGHGTHVAGIAAGSGLGIAGVAPGASLVVAKVLDANGSGSTSDVAAGIDWVVQHGARVVNLSLGGDPGFLGVDCVVGGCDAGAIAGAVEAAWDAGAIPVIAAGNNAGDLFGPSGYGGLDAVVVAATGPSGQFASDYSSTPGNAKWGVLAPGGDDPSGPTTPTCGAFDPDEIVSTYWNDGTSCYATDEGTSMATPFVSGTLALLLGRGLSQQQAVQTLLSTLNTSVTCGTGQGCLGLVDAGAAMAEAARMTGPTPTAVPPPAIGAPAGTRSAPSATSAVPMSEPEVSQPSLATTDVPVPPATTDAPVLPATAQRSGAAPRKGAVAVLRKAVPKSRGSSTIPFLVLVLVGLGLAGTAGWWTSRFLASRSTESLRT